MVVAPRSSQTSQNSGLYKHPHCTSPPLQSLLNVSYKILLLWMFLAILHFWMNTLRPNKAFSSLFDTFIKESISISPADATSFEKEPDIISVAIWLMKMIFVNYVATVELTEPLGLVNHSVSNPTYWCWDFYSAKTNK